MCNNSLDATISVIMPVYNAELYLAEAIESILCQTYPFFEFIIIDDGSSDSSLDIIKRYSKLDERIIVVSRENFGLVYTLNEAISLSKGRYIARMDADDISVPTRFATQLSYVERENLDICGGHFLLMGEDGTLDKLRLVATSEDMVRLSLISGVPFAHPSVMIKKSFLIDNDLAYGQSRYSSAEDLDLWVRATLCRARIGNVDDVILKYRVLANSLSRTNSIRIHRDTQALLDTYMSKMYGSIIKSVNEVNNKLNAEEARIFATANIRLFLKDNHISHLVRLCQLDKVVVIKSLLSEVKLRYISAKIRWFEYRQKGTYEV